MQTPAGEFDSRWLDEPCGTCRRIGLYVDELDCRNEEPEDLACHLWEPNQTGGDDERI